MNYEINYDFGLTNSHLIAQAINDLNANKSVQIRLHHNQGGNAELAVELALALLKSNNPAVQLVVDGFACSAAAFVVMSVILYRPSLIGDLTEPVCLMYHRPRTVNESTRLPYFDITSDVCESYDALFAAWCEGRQVGYSDMCAYYGNFEYVTVIERARS